MTDLRGVEPQEIETDNTGKIVGAVVIALAIGAVGAYSYGFGASQSPQAKVAMITGPVKPPSASLPLALLAAPSSVSPATPIVAPPAAIVPTSAERHIAATRPSRLARAHAIRPQVTPSPSEPAPTVSPGVDSQPAMTAPSITPPPYTPEQAAPPATSPTELAPPAPQP